MDLLFLRWLFLAKRYRGFHPETKEHERVRIFLDDLVKAHEHLVKVNEQLCREESSFEYLLSGKLVDLAMHQGQILINLRLVCLVDLRQREQGDDSCNRIDRIDS